MQRFDLIRVSVISSCLLILSGCSVVTGSSSGPSEKGREFIIEACAPLYQKDWDNTSIDSLVSYENDFIEIRNRAGSLDDSTKEVIELLAAQASRLTELNGQWWRDMPSDLINNVEQVDAATKKLEEGRNQVGEEINSICAPFFE